MLCRKTDVQEERIEKQMSRCHQTRAGPLSGGVLEDDNKMRHQLSRCSPTCWTGPVRCYGVPSFRARTGRRDGRVGLLYKRQFDPPSRRPGSDHRPLFSPRAHHRITLHRITVPLGRQHHYHLESPSGNTLIIHEAVSIAVEPGHWGEFCQPRPLSRPLHGTPRTTIFFDCATCPTAHSPSRQRLHLTPRSPHLRHLPTRPKDHSSAQPHLAKCDRTAPLTPCYNNLGSRPGRAHEQRAAGSGHQASASPPGRGASPAAHCAVSPLKKRTGRHGSQHNSHTSTRHPSASQDEAPDPCRHPDKWRALFILPLTIHVGEEASQQRQTSPKLRLGKWWHRHRRPATKSSSSRDHCST